jgi:hypothetical protein
MSTVAYSYQPFSSAKLADGDSIRRQQDLASAYCHRRAWTLDGSLNLRVLGVSAWRRDNALTGNLRTFLTAVESGRARGPDRELGVAADGSVDDSAEPRPIAEQTAALARERLPGRDHLPGLARARPLQLHLTAADLVLVLHLDVVPPTGDEVDRTGVRSGRVGPLGVNQQLPVDPSRAVSSAVRVKV